MFWHKKDKKVGWYGKQLEENIKALRNGERSRISWIFCVFAEKHEQSKLNAAKVLREMLDNLSFDEVIQIDQQMRQTTSVEWSINWRDLNINDFFTSKMDEQDKRTITVFASFNPNGFLREQAVKLMQNYDGTLPYILIRQNDWVLQVRLAASIAFTYRLQRLSDGEILIALPYAEKLKWSSRGSHGEYTNRFFEMLTTPDHLEDLKKGLDSVNIRTRRICINALFVAEPPKFELALERLSCEPEPFLRAIIFKKVIGLGQKLSNIIEIFLRDKYPVNRMLAFQHLIDTNMNGVYGIAQHLLLDRSATVRKKAQQVVHQETPEFDFRSFYFGYLDQNTNSAICGLGEKGQTSDAATISKYLDDVRISVVKSTMASLMKLDNKKYEYIILLMLDDSRAGIVKTARNLLMKPSVIDYGKVNDIYSQTLYKHTKFKCLDILFSAPKWSSIIYMLDAFSDEDEDIRTKSLVAINRWLLNFNRSFTLPSDRQREEIQIIIHKLNGKLPYKIQNELLFTVPS